MTVAPCFLSSIFDLQLFGDNPPSALFQITNFASGLAEEGDGAGYASADGHRYERDSLATIISISTTSLSPMLSATGKSKLRDSFISVITTSSEISGLVLAEDHNEAEPSRRSGSAPRESEDITYQAKSLTVPILSPTPVSPRKGVRPRTSPESHTSGSPIDFNRNVFAPQSSAMIPPRTPPPFSDLAAPLAMRPATAPPSSPAPSEFQTRRRRAAKLSKFFGVEVNALAEAVDRLPSISSRKTSLAYEGQRERSLSGGLSQQTSVIVAEARRRRFMGMNDDEDVEERDLSEVIDQLRKMRS